MKRATFSTFVPFGGFYYSLHSEVIDSLEESMFTDCDGNSGANSSNLAVIFYSHVDYSHVYGEYAKHYVDELREKTGLTSIAFEELVSPREYNFQTDRIFVEISRSDLAKMLKAVRGKRLNKKIKDLYTTRSGFISFYPNCISKWPKIEEWDYNHVGAVLSAYIEFKHPALEQEIAEEIYSDGYVCSYLYDAADFTGKSACDLASVIRELQENHLYPLSRPPQSFLPLVRHESQNHS